MAWKPKPMQVQCPQCKATDIFTPSRDIIAFFPRCNKCGVEMVVLGQVDLLGWITNLKNWF
ncbi:MULTISPECIES: hypothetical protein [unclassified Acinetobacter]|uniref:hypothetical protein n=1 Tax=unclassified Acinetobacter TaxID=196816 RepID=UPI00244CCD0D|nr:MULTISPECIES: hypothetical protein [unclassified Acinetobacter]MDH0032112.1 hypothetical protein [Acinetobacter sp. GD04021]MDH0887871.1 hypothetical protein [Acinetobacter sp. GD03873]MDH1081929.1 hypothetical protein [Acinetobacter sp. GD03983]MDH2191187.1 hypothetical protein [Acinetobacter sp. GD03645]MDH2204628.1 hypothetical protein [Acinetobacter sp. GD03647]